MNLTLGRPRVLLVRPNGLQSVANDVDLAWHDRDWHADARTVTVVEKLERRSGSLVDAFNVLWAEALTWRDAGRVDHFAMCHADVMPGSWWINDLLAEMRRHNAAVCSAVVAIKDRERRLTSTAIGKVGDPYANRCLSRAELDALPDTFDTSRACRPGELLLINTGLWVCDLRQAWCERWVFPQTCRIVHDGTRWNSELLTEDWELSRFLHAEGVRYVATRKVETRHFGIDSWDVGPRKRDLVTKAASA